MSEDLTAAQIAATYEGMLHAVQSITDIIDGNTLSPFNNANKQDYMDRSVGHLEAMKVKTFWTTEDMSPIDAAITAGKAWSE